MFEVGGGRGSRGEGIMTMMKMMLGRRSADMGSNEEV